MEYFVSAAADRVADRVANGLRNHGIDVCDEYHDDAIIISLGGDGSILYNARVHGEPRILPVVAGDSRGNKIQVEQDELAQRIELVESGTEGDSFWIEEYRKLVARIDDEEIRSDFGALNDIHVHHGTPAKAAKFRAEIRDGDEVIFEADRVIGDGLVVATSFGSSAYFRSITDGVFTSGMGVGFNNTHRPVTAPKWVVLSPAGRVSVEVHEVTHGETPVLVRDDDPDPFALESDQTVEITLSDRTVEIIRFDR